MNGNNQGVIGFRDKRPESQKMNILALCAVIQAAAGWKPFWLLTSVL